MNIAILTLGTRGDVQPFVALGLGLKRKGHRVTIATSKDFESLIREYGLDYGYIDADMLEMLNDPQVRKQMKLGGNPLKLLKLANEMLREVFRGAWEASRDADLIVYHPKILAATSIAEAKRIPAFFSSALPITPTGDFPNMFVPPSWKLGRRFNRATHTLLLRGMSSPYLKTINDFRRESLNLPPRKRFYDDFTLNGKPVPILYAYSQHVIPKPDDWGDEVHLTGYWFLDAPDTWQPPADLMAFLNAGAPPVYAGFGSMVWNDPHAAARTVIEALQRTGQRGVLAKGWGGLAASDVPENIFMVESVPHDWLFERMSAVVHHGGAGTTAAGLRAGKPTVICPFIADQPLWGSRVQALGVGPAPISQWKLTVDALANAIQAAVSDMEMRRRAAKLGEKIRAEDGVGNAVAIIERELVTA